jgi:hypothetical protein
MNIAAVKILLLPLILTLLFTAPARAAGESKLPLPYGLYMPEGADCPKPGETPDRTQACYYNEEGLSFYLRRCKLLSVRHQGNVYYLTQRCLAKGEDYLTLDFTVTIKSKTFFSLLNTEWEQQRTGKKETVYHYCGKSPL